MNFRNYILILMGTSVFGAPVEERVNNLPGLEYPVNYNQYSGYLRGTKGRHLHYWFIESQNNASSDPLILWLNGGPGCSSLSGLLSENGPFKVSNSNNEVLVPNPYAWNIVGNILYLESPACVGFSFDDRKNCETSDGEVNQMNYNALQNFFSKFPEYVNRDFYITGEGYAGIYIPSLSMIIVKDKTFPGNFKGYAIGNGLLNYTTSDTSVMFFGYHHGLIGQKDWLELTSACCQGFEVKEEKKCPFDRSCTHCDEAYTKATSIIFNKNLNTYNLYGDCKKHQNQGSIDRTRYIFALQNLFRNSRSLSNGDLPCLDSSKEVNYLNNPKVRRSLHIPKYVQEWQTCSLKVNMTYDRVVKSTMTYIQELQMRGIRGLLYNGDVDMVFNFLAKEWDVAAMGLKLIENRTSWMFNHQVGGYDERYENLDLATVRGAGHMVPAEKPAEALHLIKAFINNEKY